MAKQGSSKPFYKTVTALANTCDITYSRPHGSYPPHRAVKIALDTLTGNSRSTEHSLGKDHTVLLVITPFTDSARNNSAEKTTITAITTKMARASASDYNLQISQVDWVQFFKHFWLYADLFQSVAVQSPPTIASIFIFDVIADKVH